MNGVALRQEIAAITSETGSDHHRLGLRVQSLSDDTRLFDDSSAMAAIAVEAFTASGREVEGLDAAPTEGEPVSPGLQATLDDDIPF